MNRTFSEVAGCTVIQSGLHTSFWADAVATACHIRNRCSNGTLGGEIPYEKWTVEELGYLRVFGSKVFVLNKTPGKGKFEARSKEGIFVGYPRQSKGYRVWIPSERRLAITLDVKFMENSRMQSLNEGSEVETNVDEDHEDEWEMPVRADEDDTNEIPQRKRIKVLRIIT